MASEPNMKIGIGANTQDFEKGARKVKQEMRDLDKVSADALASIGSAMGVDTQKLTQFTNALSGLGSKLQQTGNEGAAAFGKMITAATPLAGVIAGIGIAGATLAFKALNDEAEAFKNTVAGANIELMTTAYVETFRQALHDMHSETGKAAAETMSSFEKAWKTAWPRFVEALRSGAIPVPGQMIGSGISKSNANIESAEGKATDAAKLTDDIYKLERKRKEQAVELAKINAQIADNIAIARDNSQGVLARQNAIAEAERLYAQKKEMTVELEGQLAVLYKQRSDQASDNIAAADATLAQEARRFEVERAITLEETSLRRIKNTVANISKKETEEMKKQQELLQQRIDTIGSLSAFEGGINVPAIKLPTELVLPQNEVNDFKAHLVADLGFVRIGVALDPDSVEKVRDFSHEIESLVSQAAEGIGEAIGQLGAALISGKDPWTAFANSAMSSFGDMAIAVGKIAISAGMATLGIKAAFEKLNGYVAIAAGVALIAVGTAVKSGLSSIANGNYSASSGTVNYSSLASSPSSNAEQKDIYVKVSGTLKADGDQLLAVISNAEETNRITT